MNEPQHSSTAAASDGRAVSGICRASSAQPPKGLFGGTNVRYEEDMGASIFKTLNDSSPIAGNECLVFSH
ncbi:hypothetical protein PoB_006002200 [Plakobranchus ocellatus]|uniref:Uncharacterized protein n=1 Tax=Plakobranchus ocellatus TaxID=259542 RepID=A0AAV4CNS9_9GAST|nr:hypothetical protein PoB_006002200 [Plakobranchus ocellatus]